MQSEWVLDVYGLGLAENGNGASGALRLFVERATQVEPDFSSTTSALRRNASAGWSMVCP